MKSPRGAIASAVLAWLLMTGCTTAPTAPERPSTTSTAAPNIAAPPAAATSAPATSAAATFTATAFTAAAPTTAAAASPAAQPTTAGPAVSAAAAATTTRSADAAAMSNSPRPSSIRLPPTGGAVDYQLGGGYPVPAGVAIVTRDSTDVPAAGVYSICYVNGFQTQPDDRAAWLADHPELVLRRGGTPLEDENWPDEMILDTSTATHRQAVLAVVGLRIDRCRAAGFQAVEIDNLDSDTRSAGALVAADNRAMATLYADRAHRSGLAIAQKNTVDQAGILRSTAGFDFAVAEECYRYDECGAYRTVYGDHVIDIEYIDNLRSTFADACADKDSPRSMVLRDRQLRPAGESGHEYQRC